MDNRTNKKNRKGKSLPLSLWPSKARSLAWLGGPATACPPPFSPLPRVAQPSLPARPAAQPLFSPCTACRLSPGAAQLPRPAPFPPSLSACSATQPPARGARHARPVGVGRAVAQPPPPPGGVHLSAPKEVVPCSSPYSPRRVFLSLPSVVCSPDAPFFPFIAPAARNRSRASTPSVRATSSLW
jgi:hypothetical protein